MQRLVGMALVVILLWGCGSGGTGTWPGSTTVAATAGPIATAGPVATVEATAAAAAADTSIPTATVFSPAEPAPTELQDGRSLGRADAPVTLDVWSDFQCPGCGVLSRDVEPRVVDRYVRAGTVRMTYHDFAFLGEESLTAATAARCGGNQRRFWHYMQYLYANQGGENLGVYDRTLFDGIARDLGLNLDTFAACLTDEKARQAVLDETAEGNRLSIRSTPTIFVNGTKVDSLDYAAITKAIDAVLSPATPPPSSSLAPSGSAAP